MTRLAVLALCALLLVPATSLADGGDSPVVGAVSVTGVTRDSATVTAHVGPGDDKTEWWVEYGSSATTPLKIKKAASVTVTLPGLAAGTVYDIRVVVESENGISESTARFTTLPPADTAPQAGDPAPAPSVTTPVLGETVAVAATGTVRVRTPGSDAFTPLTSTASLPVGTVVDASGGSVSLTSALPDGSTQDGKFGGGRFAMRQGDGGRVNLHLRGRLYCGDRALASAASTSRRRRSLWGKDDGGRYRTHGRDSVATVRGTSWSTTDTCSSTITTVTEGAVDVRIRRSGRIVRVAAGERHVARRR